MPLQQVLVRQTKTNNDTFLIIKYDYNKLEKSINCFIFFFLDFYNNHKKAKKQIKFWHLKRCRQPICSILLYNIDKRNLFQNYSHHCPKQKIQFFLYLLFRKFDFNRILTAGKQIG